MRNSQGPGEPPPKWGGMGSLPTCPFGLIIWSTFSPPGISHSFSTPILWKTPVTEEGHGYEVLSAFLTPWCLASNAFPSVFSWVSERALAGLCDFASPMGKLTLSGGLSRHLDIKARSVCLVVVWSSPALPPCGATAIITLTVGCQVRTRQGWPMLETHVSSCASLAPMTDNNRLSRPVSQHIASGGITTQLQLEPQVSPLCHPKRGMSCFSAISPLLSVKRDGPR